MSEPKTLLPVHGFVLAGGQSTRMGQDKALLCVDGQPMVALAVARLRSFCVQVSLAGNREDLRAWAPVVPEPRQGAGPAAGIEAGLQAAQLPWVLFVPVDVPRVPGELLRSWAEAVLAREANGVRLSYLAAHGQRQPAFCLLDRRCATAWTRAMAEHGLRLDRLFEQVATTQGPDALWIATAEELPYVRQHARADIGAWFRNINTPEEFRDATGGTEGTGVGAVPAGQEPERRA